MTARPTQQQLEHELHVEFEAGLVQVRALSDCLEQLVGIVEELAAGLPSGTPPEIARRLEELRWSIGRIW
jgi:hypothetical protein